MTRGLPLFLALILLAALVYAAPAAELKWAALAGLGILSLVTLPVGERR